MQLPYCKKMEKDEYQGKKETTPTTGGNNCRWGTETQSGEKTGAMNG